MAQKITMKEQVLQFVETKGSASFTDIQKFIVDTKFGSGTYGSRMINDWVWNKETKSYEKKLVLKNPYRGYYCAAFSIGYYNRRERKYLPGGYFLRGANRLAKQENGKYSVIRENK